MDATVRDTKVWWRSASSWNEEPGCYPNDLVLVLVEVSDKSRNCLVDQEESSRYVSMGHWYPELKLRNGKVEPGHWEVVGWNWCQDTFQANETDKVIGWAPLPTAS